MNMETILQELCKKIKHMDKQSFDKMIDRLNSAYDKSHKTVYDEEWYRRQGV